MFCGELKEIEKIIALYARLFFLKKTGRLPKEAFSGN